MALSSAKARRTAARLAAVQALYSMEVGEGNASMAVHNLTGMRQAGIDEALIEPDAAMLANISKGVTERLSDVDGLITGALEGRPIERTEATLRAILRAGTFELLTDAETHPGIIINDYVNVAHAFFDAGEPTKVNAVLDKVARQLERLS